MNERYVVMKSGFCYEEQEICKSIYVKPFIYGIYITEEKAIDKLQSVISNIDTDCDIFGVEEQIWDKKTYSWLPNKEYGASGSLRRLYEFPETRKPH